MRHCYQIIPLMRNTIFGLWLVTSILSFAGYHTTIAQTTREQQLRAALESGDPKQILQQLSAMREVDRPSFEANNYDYLQARLSETEGNSAQANDSYQSVVSRQSVLAQYALWHLAESARSIGDLVLERERLRRL